MVCNEPWYNGVSLCTIVQESHAALPMNPYPGYIFDPIPLVKGIGIQEGSLCLASYTLGTPSWGTFSMSAFPWGAQTPFFGIVPSLQFKYESVLDAATSG